MKKVILSALLIASSVSLAACSTANSSGVDSAAPVFEKRVTK
jgi:predicted small secreted protein